MMQTMTTTPVSDVMAIWRRNGGAQAAGAGLSTRLSGDEMLSASAVSYNSSTWGCTGGADEAVGAAILPGHVYCSSR